MTKVTIPAGTTRQLQFTVTYSSDWSVAGDQSDPLIAANVSSAKFLIKRQPLIHDLNSTDSDAVVTKTTASGIAVATGTVTVTLTAGDTDDLDGNYRGSLRLFMSDGSVHDVEVDSLPYIDLEFLKGAVKAVS